MKNDPMYALLEQTCPAAVPICKKIAKEFQKIPVGAI